MEVGALGDLSNNKFAAAMRELANGLVGWSAILLFAFYCWHIGVSDRAQFFSWKAMGMILVGEIVFAVIIKIANVIFAAVLTPLGLPFMLMDRMRSAQNIQNSSLVLFGLGACVAAWYFSVYSFQHTYS